MSAGSLEKKRVVFLVRAKNAKERKRVRKLIKRQGLEIENERQVVTGLLTDGKTRPSRRYTEGKYITEQSEVKRKVGFEVSR